MKRPLSLYCLLFLVTVWIYVFLDGVPLSSYEDDTGKEAHVIGEVVAKEVKNQSQIVYLENVTVSDANESNQMKHEDGIICYLSEGEMPKLGSVVVLQGKIETFDPATNPGEFDRKEYYLIKGYGAQLKYAVIVKKGMSWNWYKEGLWQLRSKLAMVIDRCFLQEDAAVMKAMLLGDKSTLEVDIKELYQASGIAHILAISGLHISILGMGLYKVLRKSSLPVLPSVMISAFFMINYAIMTGNSTSTLRAVVMFTLFVVSDIFKRSYDLMTALAISAVIVVLLHPYEVLTSAFWLSYLAVFGIAVFYPAVTVGITLENRKKNQWLQSFLGGFCVTLFTLPMILCCYYEFPLYSVLINMVVLPCMAYLLLGGIAALFSGCFVTFLGKFLSWPCHCILRLYYLLCIGMEYLPYHTCVIGCPKGWQIAGFYIIMLILIIGGKRIKIPVRIGMLLLAMVILFIHNSEGALIAMLDVGQGDGICICEEDYVVMIDGGSSSKSNLAQYQLLPFFRYEGISNIDYWFVTHPDEDHISGLIEILEDNSNEITIDAIIIPDAYGVETDFAELISLANRHNIPIMRMACGDSMKLNELSVTCLHPSHAYITNDVNTYSLVLEISYHNFTGIFTGDATYESEECVMEYIKERGMPVGGYQLLKVGHHGSDTSSSAVFLQTLQPENAWISCGRNNKYGHPDAITLRRLEAMGINCYRTDECGALLYTVK